MMRIEIDVGGANTDTGKGNLLDNSARAPVEVVGDLNVG